MLDGQVVDTPSTTQAISEPPAPRHGVARRTTKRLVRPSRKWPPLQARKLEPTSTVKVESLKYSVSISLAGSAPIPRAYPHTHAAIASVNPILPNRRIVPSRPGLRGAAASPAPIQGTEP